MAQSNWIHQAQMDITMALVDDMNSVFEAQGWGTPNFHTGAAVSDNVPATHSCCYIPMTDAIKTTLENVVMNDLRITYHDNTPGLGVERLDEHLAGNGLVRIVEVVNP